MGNRTPQGPNTEVIEYLTLQDLCRSCGLQSEWIIELVDHGILEPTGTGASDWCFDSASLTRVWKVRRLQQDLDLNLPAVALVLSLVEETVQLRYRLAQLEPVGNDVQDVAEIL